MRSHDTWLPFIVLAGLVVIALQFTNKIPVIEKPVLTAEKPVAAAEKSAPAAEQPADCNIEATAAVVTDLDLLSLSDNPGHIRDGAFHDLPLDCKHDAESPGIADYTCRAYIASFNGVGARHIMFFFLQDELNMVRVWYPPASQEAMLAMLRERYGEEQDFDTMLGPDEPHTVGWIRPNGIIAIHDRVVGKEKYEAFLWLSPNQVAGSPFWPAQPDND